MTSPQPSTKSLTDTELALMMARPETRMLFICIAVGATGIVQGFRSGWTTGALVLLVGSVLSVIGMMAFARTVVRPEVSMTASLSAMGGFAPFLFGCYLVFLRGFWNGRLLFSHFSVTHLIATLVFIYLGYRIVYWCWQLSEIAEAIRTGRLVVRDAAPESANRAS